MYSSTETLHATDAASLAEAIARRCDKAKATRTGWQACCPAHDDSNPSLTITPRNEKVLLRCHAGCPVKSIVAALDLSMKDLFIEGRAPRRRGSQHGKEETIYSYTDINGTVVHETVRYHQPDGDKTFRQRRPHPTKPGDYLWDLKGIQPVLYHLPHVLTAIQAGQLVYIVEGEKDADALAQRGLTATCNAMGAGQWREHYSETLRGAHCIILPDNDVAGHNHAAKVARSLTDIAASVKILALPDLPPKGDVSDWLQAEHTRAELEALVEQTPPEADWETPGKTAAALLARLPTLDKDAQEEAILDAMPALAGLDMTSWIRRKHQLKAAVPSVNLNDLERVRSALRRDLAAQDSSSRGNAQAQIAADLQGAYGGTWAYDLSRQGWMTYDNGLWTPLDTGMISQHIGAFMDQRLRCEYTWHDLSGVEHLLRTRLARALALELPGWLPFRNGVLCLETMTLHPHSPERAYTWQLPHHYDSGATCPKTLACLHEAVGGIHEQVQVLRAHAKAVVTRRVDLQRYLEMIGPGGTGKGTYTRLLTALVGSENTFSTELKHLEANRFETSNLRGKMLMVITDAERYSGPVNALKAITGQDFVRMEEKFKAQRTEVAPVMVVVAANEAIQSADYTSGLVRRRLSMAFRHRPATPRDLLSWYGGTWHGELAPEIPGVLNWVLALPDATMEALLLHTTTLVPSLKETWVQSLVETNPLADWANQSLIYDPERDDQGNHKAIAKVGVAKKLERSNDYDLQNTWLYPNYRAWIDATGHKHLSQRKFTDRLKDLLESQLRLPEVVHKVDAKGSRFFGIRLRPYSDTETRLLITVPSTPMMDVRDTMRDETRTSDGCEGCEGYFKSFAIDHPTYLGNGGETIDSSTQTKVGGVLYREGDPKNASLASHPSSAPRNGPCEPSPSLTIIRDAAGNEIGVEI